MMFAVFKIQCVLYACCISQSDLAILQALHNHIELVATILDWGALKERRWTSNSRIDFALASIVI